MTEEIWLQFDTPHELFRAILEHPKSQRERRRKRMLLACACCRRVWELFEDEKLKRAIELAERDADRYICTQELATSHDGVLRMLHHLGWGLHHSCQPYIAVHAMCNVDVPLVFAAIRSMVQHRDPYGAKQAKLLAAEKAAQSALIRDIFGNPFRPVTFSPEWLTSTVVALAQHMYESRDFSAMPILADALQDAGCDNEEVLNHCRQAGEHVRGCWVVDLILSKDR
jgi:hypothetical protein